MKNLMAAAMIAVICAAASAQQIPTAMDVLQGPLDGVRDAIAAEYEQLLLTEPEAAGRVTVSFTIGTDGKVVACNASGASPTLDAETCKLIIRRFRFKAALDTSGQPIEETKSQRVTWRLPK